LISLDEYLNTTYRPDAEFVDSALVERNSGTPLHSLTQVIAGSHLHQYRKSHALQVLMSVRVRVGAGRFRVPDLLVLENPTPAASLLQMFPP
jgi:hypothetical protein